MADPLERLRSADRGLLEGHADQALATSLQDRLAFGDPLGSRAAGTCDGCDPHRDRLLPHRLRDDSLCSTLALAPYVYPSDVPKGLQGQRIVIVHGSKDRIASPNRAYELAQRLSALTPTAYVLVEGAKHAMLARHGVFSSLAAEFAAATLLGRSDDSVIARIADGETFIEL